MGVRWKFSPIQYNFRFDVLRAISLYSLFLAGRQYKIPLFSALESCSLCSNLGIIDNTTPRANKVGVDHGGLVKWFYYCQRKLMITQVLSIQGVFLPLCSWYLNLNIWSCCDANRCTENSFSELTTMGFDLKVIYGPKPGRSAEFPILKNNRAL